MSIYLLQNGTQTGPFPAGELFESFKTGNIPADARAWTEGLPEWVPISSLFEGYQPPLSAPLPNPAVEGGEPPWWTYIIKGIVYFLAVYLLITYGADYLKRLRPSTAKSLAVEGQIELMVRKTAPLDFGGDATSTQCSLQVTNKTDSLFRLVTLEVQTLDSSGVVTATATKSLESLAPEQVRQVEVNFLGAPLAKISKISGLLRSATVQKADGSLKNIERIALTMVHFDEAHGNILSLEAVKRHAPGIWTGNNNEGALLRVEIKSDGTTTEYIAIPTDDNWGKGTPGRWEPFTGKYDNTGRRYYGLQFGSGAYTIMESSTEMTHPNLRMTLTKADSFPFSQ